MIKVYLANLGKYNEGELVGEWLELPCTEEEIEQKLQEYKETHSGKDFMCDVSTKTIEDICQLLQCQPQDLIEWKVDLNPELSYENRFKG